MNSVFFKITITFTLSTIAVYFLFAIYMADFNILQWEQSSRGWFLTLLLALYLFGFICICASEEEKQKKLKKECRFR